MVILPLVTHKTMIRFLQLFLCLFSTFALGQPKQFVTWTYDQKKVSKDEFELVFKAKIEKGYHLYSQKEYCDTIILTNGKTIITKVMEEDDNVVRYRPANHPESNIKSISKKDVRRVSYIGGPLATLFQFDKSADYLLVGTTQEPKSHETYEPMFELTIASFENSAVFVQKVRALTDKPFSVSGLIDGMACNESQCQKFSPPFQFSFKLSGAEPSASGDSSTLNVADTLIHEDSLASGTGELRENEMHFESVKPAPLENKTLWGLFIGGFLGGLLALLTPCVFPMIPMTVSFFIKQSKTKLMGIRNAILYSISIIVIYILLGLGVTLIFGADAVNNMATNVWFNLSFFVLLVIFAISFLGAFEITLPSSFVNRMDAKSDRGGLLGI